MNLKNRKILQFRTHIDPQIPPKPRNAFSKKELPNWEMEITPIGVYVKAILGVIGGRTETHEHIVPFANVQSIKLAPETAAEKDKDDDKETA